MESADSGRAKPVSGPASPGQRERSRERQSLELARVRVQRDLEAATHPGHRASLEAALRHLDKKIATLS